jgi:hypothetical protein
MERHEENDQATEPLEQEAAPRPPSPARLPEPEKAKVIYFAYDPETYEVLCRPGQRLSPKKAQRLQDIQLYAHVVASAE